MINAANFVRALKDNAKNDQPLLVLGTVDPAYFSGRPKVTFDGESAVSTKSYPYLGSYTPTANDRVLLARSGHTWVVLGEVT